MRFRVNDVSWSLMVCAVMHGEGAEEENDRSLAPHNVHL